MTMRSLCSVTLAVIFSTALTTCTGKDLSVDEILHILGNDDLTDALTLEANDDDYEEEAQENNGAENIENKRPFLQRKGDPDAGSLWPKVNGVPTVYFDYGSTPVPQSSLDKAMNHIQNHTCIRFYEANSTHYFPKLVFEDSSGCSASIGRSHWFLGPTSQQSVNLGYRCSSVRLVVHEISHALGLHHEQARSDRDDYVKVIYDNVESNRAFNFDKADTMNLNTEYDFTSNMHYGQFTFTSNGGQTLTTRDPLMKGLITTPRFGLSFMDKSILNQMYGCTDFWLAQCGMEGPDPCQNMGYFGAECKCVCPLGTSGDLCQTKERKYSEALAQLLTPRNEVIKEPTTISFSSTTEYYTTFTKLIQAPRGHRVVLTVEHFNAEYKLGDPSKCYYEGIEIGTSSEVGAGKVYCGRDLKEGQTFISKLNELTIFYWKQLLTNDRKTGFKFNVRFQWIFHQCRDVSRSVKGLFSRCRK